MNPELIKYIKENVFALYAQNDEGHNLEHILYVIRRSLQFADRIDNINLDMVYTIAAYHDVGHHIDAKNHEKISANICYQDKNLRDFFSEEQMIIIKEAIEDHRASSKTEPRSIYGKIVSSADRTTSVDDILKRCYYYRKKHGKYRPTREMLEDIKKHITEKYGKKGYASEKIYFEDKDYIEFLKQINSLLENSDQFENRFRKANNLEDEKGEWEKNYERVLSPKSP